MQTTLQAQAYGNEQSLYMALELSAKEWKLCFGDGGQLRHKTVAAGDREAVLETVRRMRERFGLSAQSPVVSGYEAGRDGFWVQRWLESVGIGCVVMDPASIEVSRRQRKAKSDRLDARKLLELLIRRYGRGEQPAPFSAVQVPSETAEDVRRLHRERERLVKERKSHRSRLASLLATQGVAVPKRFDESTLRGLRRWDGEPLPATLEAELTREAQRLQQVQTQLKELEAEQQRQLSSAPGAAYEQMRQLMQLRAIGVQGAWTLVLELFGWRRFRNRRELAGCVGLTPTPWGSGDLEREQGIGKSGNRRCRALMVELAWQWLRYQPDSELSRWYRRRFLDGGKRQRRSGIVALARKLLVALWRYVETGELPAGARLKSA